MAFEGPQRPFAETPQGQHGGSCRCGPVTETVHDPMGHNRGKGNPQEGPPQRNRQGNIMPYIGPYLIPYLINMPFYIDITSYLTNTISYLTNIIPQISNLNFFEKSALSLGCYF